MMHDNLMKLAYKRQLIGAGLGALAGAGTGYAATSNEDKRLRNTLIGAGAGGVLGAGIGHLTRERVPVSAPTGGGGYSPPRKSSPSGDPFAGRRGPANRPITVQPNRSRDQQAADATAAVRERMEARTFEGRQRAARAARNQQPSVVATGAKRSMTPEQIEALRNSPEALAKRQARALHKADDIKYRAYNFDYAKPDEIPAIRKNVLADLRNATDERLQLHAAQADSSLHRHAARKVQADRLRADQAARLEQPTYTRGGRTRLRATEIEARRNTEEALAKRRERQLLAASTHRATAVSGGSEAQRLNIRKDALSTMRGYTPEQLSDVAASPYATQQQRIIARHLMRPRVTAAAPAPRILATQTPLTVNAPPAPVSQARAAIGRPVALPPQRVSVMRPTISAAAPSAR